MANKLPAAAEEFKESYAQVWDAFAQLGDRSHNAGPLDERMRRLIKVALAIGAGLEGGTHSAVRNALAAGITHEEIKHLVVLAITTLGFPATIRALTWVGDILRSSEAGDASTE